MGELGHLDAAEPEVEPADLPPSEADGALDPGRAQVGRATCANSPRTTTRASPSISTSISSPARCAIEGEGRAERLIVERTALDEAGQSVGTGETYAIPASLIVSCIGYHTPRIDGVPYDERGGQIRQ